MLFILSKLIFTTILTEAITEILAKADIFEPLRQRVFNRIKEGNFFEWLDGLIGCGYCISVWVGLFISLLFFYGDNLLISKYIDWFFIGLFLHRTSNVWHFIIDWLSRSRGGIYQ